MFNILNLFKFRPRIKNTYDDIIFVRNQLAACKKLYESLKIINHELLKENKSLKREIGRLKKNA